MIVQAESAVNFLLNYIPASHHQPFRIFLLPLLEYLLLSLGSSFVTFGKIRMQVPIGL
jgi:hypothetical protein